MLLLPIIICWKRLFCDWEPANDSCIRIVAWIKFGSAQNGTLGDWLLLLLLFDYTTELESLVLIHYWYDTWGGCCCCCPNGIEEPKSATRRYELHTLSKTIKKTYKQMDFGSLFVAVVVAEVYYYCYYDHCYLLAVETMD